MKKRTIISIVSILLLLIFVSVTAAIVKADHYYFDERTFPVVLVSDIHMGSEKCEWDQCGGSIEEAFQYVLDNTGDALIVTAGDNTDASAYSDNQETASALREKDKEKLLEMTKGREVLWANGNHDRQTYVSGKEYYSYDKNNWRFIIIHTTNVVGDQLEWLKEQLKTDKNKIVVMHHPVFKQGKMEILSRYENLVQLFAENHVRYVISGHWHGDKYEREMDGVIYKALRGMTYMYKSVNGPRYEIKDLEYTYMETKGDQLSPRAKDSLYKIHQFLGK